MRNQNAVEFYEQYDLTRLYGWTPSIVAMQGGVVNMDSYTPLAYARRTVQSMRDYLQRPTGRAVTVQEIVDYLYRVADRYGIDRNVAYRQIEAESRFNPRAVSRAGAQGVAQFMPGTAARYGLADPFDPYASLDAWGLYMRDLLKMHGGDYSRALASYNWGEGRVLEAVKNWGASWLTKAPKETRDYVARILGASNQGQQVPADRYGNRPGDCLDVNLKRVPCDSPDAVGEVISDAEAEQYKPGGALNPAECSTFDIGCHLEKFFTGDTAKDLAKRGGLVLLAVVLLALAIISLK